MSPATPLLPRANRQLRSPTSPFISITIIEFFIVELVDAAGLLLAVPPRACSAAVAPHHHGYGAYVAPPPST